VIRYGADSLRPGFYRRLSAFIGGLPKKAVGPPMNADKTGSGTPALRNVKIS